jgi:hypothetical protein
MDKWLKTGSVGKTRDNEPSPSENVLSGPKCAKLGSDGKIQRGVGKSQAKKGKYDDNQAPSSSGLRVVVIRNVQNRGV